MRSAHAAVTGTVNHAVVTARRPLPGHGSIYDALGDGFTLIRCAPHADVKSILDAAAHMAIPLQVLDLSGLPECRGSYDADLVLVRPDQHIAGSVRTTV